MGLSLYCAGLDRLGDTGVSPVGADHDLRPLDDGGSALLATADADDCAVLDDHVLDGELLAHLGASSGSGVDEDLVEHCPPRRVPGGDAVAGTRAAGDRERPEVERVALDGRAARGCDLVEEAPPVQRGDAGGVDHVGRHGVARERRPIHDQHSVALAGEQHRSRRTGAAGAHDDGVVVSSHGR